MAVDMFPITIDFQLEKNRYVSYTQHQSARIVPCGVRSIAKKTEVVKIFHFKQFYKYIVFLDAGNGGCKKGMKNYIDVNVCIDMVCGDTTDSIN